MQEFTSTVTEIKYLNDEVFIISLSCPDDFTFEAGQFVIIKFTEDGKPKPRSYSIFNPPSQKGMLQSCIKLVEGGFASEIFKKTKEGDTFTIKGALGGMRFNPVTKKHMFLCTGSGITPFYSIVMEYLEKNPDHEFTLVFGTRTQKDLFLYDELTKLDKEHSNFTYIPTLTREEWDGAQGRVHAHIPEDISDTTFYICGLKDMVLGTKEILEEKGVASENIKFERYT